MVATKNLQPRGRPRTFDRDRAIETAQRLFQERGYDGVGVADLGKALGITPPSFYHAFGSKAGLFDKVLDHYAGGFGQFLPDALAGGGDVVAAIDWVLGDAARLYASENGVAGCLVIDGARGSSDAEARALTAHRMAESHAMIAARIGQEFPDRAEELASIVTIALKGLSAAARDGASPAELTAFAQMAIEGFKVSLRKR